MGDKPKKTSTYDMLKSLDKKVQQNKSQREKRDSNSRNFERKRRRSESPRNQDRRPPRKIPEINLAVDDVDHDVPDRSFGDLYCKACDSHMNSDQMWEAHIQGKRHQKHVRRGDQGDQKYSVLDEDPLILEDIKKSTESIVGLQHCCEMRRLEGRPTYQCFMCSACFPNGPSLLEHVVGLKHRMAYLKEHDPVKHDLIDKTNLKKGMIEPVVAECIRLHQDKHGTGIMQVKLDRSKPGPSLPPSNRKPVQDDFGSNSKKDDRRYPEERDEGFRFGKHTQDYQHQRSRHPEDRYEDRRSPYDRERDRPRYSPERYPPPRYPRGESPPPHMMGRRSPPMVPYERGYHHGPDHQSGNNSQWPAAHQPTEPQTSAAEVRGRAEEGRSSNVNLFQSLMKIIETMPNMMFLEIVLHKMETMTPAENELAMLQKIGNHMISIVMNEKLQKLSPDLLGKYQGGNAKQPEPVQQQQNSSLSSNNLRSLMSLVSQFNSAKAASSSSSSFDWVNQIAEDNANAPTFMTSSSISWDSSSSAATEIPGLTLSSFSNNEEFTQQRMQNSVPNSLPFWGSETSLRGNNF